METSGITKLLVLGVYLIMMVFVGVIFYKKTSNFEDYILGGRKLSSWTAALSAQASDMSGWLLLGLPAAAYAGGLSEAWIAIGLAAGTYLNWKFVAKRLRKYTEVSKNSLTLSDFFENRFRDNTNILRVVSGLVILVFFVVYTSAQFAAGAKLFELVLGVDYTLALLIGVIVIIAYTFLGGFMAVSMTDAVQGILMFFALIIVPFVAIAELGGFAKLSSEFANAGVGYSNLFNNADGSALTAISVISLMAWGLGYFGQPHILARFMAIKSGGEVKKARIIAMVWVLIALAAAVFVGMVGRAYFGGALEDSEKVFMLMVDGIFPAVIAGILLAAILAASMSTADSQLLVTASTISEDFYLKYFKKDADDKQLIWVGRISVLAVAIIAAIIAIDPNSSVFGLVSNAWAGFGAAFGPVIILSLFWRRMNKWGAMAGIVSGAAFVFIWKAIAASATAPIFSLYEIVPAFFAATIMIFVVSLITKAPEQEILDEFDSVK